MANLEQQPDVYGFFTKKIDVINKKSYKKIAFLGISIGCGLFFGVSFISGMGSAFHSYSAWETQKNTVYKQNLTNMTAKIKNINAEDFNNFMTYMKSQSTMYDEKSNLISTSIISAEHDWIEVKKESSRSVLPLSNAEELSNELLKHKKHVEEDISKLQSTFTKIANNNTESLTQKEVENFMNSYQSFKSNLIIHDVDFEKSLNAYVFSVYDGNKNYNQEHKIYDQLKTLDAKIENSANVLNVSNNTNNTNTANTTTNTPAIKPKI
jgi:hypothetical protein